jgi:outer membrane usher protein
VLAVEVNGKLISEFGSLFRDGRGRYFAAADLFPAARLSLPNATPIQVQGILYYPLDAIQGLTYRFVPEQQTLALAVPPWAFATAVMKLAGGTTEKPAPPDPGFFLNHNFQVGGSGDNYSVSGTQELGFFSKLGVFTTRYIGRNLTNAAVATRLDTQFAHDFPERIVTLTIGDNVSASSPWGMIVNYAGVRWASKFATQPSFIPFALPSIAGQASVPSTVDLYVNGVRTSQQTVDAGPFTIRDIPAITPQGNVQMVVTDMMGHQQVVSMAFITTPQLLRKGISNYTYEAGTLRNDYGLRSFAYNSWFMEGTHARGLTNSMTLSLRGEVQSHRQAFGAGLDTGVQSLGLVGAGAAVSHDDKGNVGGLVYAHLQHATRAFGFSVNAESTTANFQQLGLLAGQHATRRLFQAQVSRALDRHATVSIAGLREEKPTVPVYDRNGRLLSHFSTISPGLNINFRGGASIVISGYYAPELKQRASANISLLIPLGNHRMLTASSGYQDGKTSPSVEFTQQLPMGTGWGYRVRTSSSNDLQLPGVDAGATYQSSVGTLNLEAGQQRTLPTTWRFDYSGGTVLLHRRLELSRSLSDGFALVDASGTPGIGVLANNQYIAATNRHGLAIVPYLPSYNPSVIALDDKNLSLDLDVDLTQKTIIPMPHSGVFVNFKAKPIRGAVLKLVTEDGADVPVGAEATVNGEETTYQVVLRGELYVPEISFPASIRVHWDETACEATVPSPPNANELLPRIGPISCRKIK